MTRALVTGGFLLPSVPGRTPALVGVLTVHEVGVHVRSVVLPEFGPSRDTVGGTLLTP